MIVGLMDGDTVPIITWTIANAPANIGTPSQYPLKRYQSDFQYVYNVSAQLGARHTIKFGADVRRNQLNDEIQNYHRGNWQFTAAGPYNALENFVRGIVQFYQQGFGPEENGYRSTETNLYVQDSWRMTPSLTLDLGARFERVGSPSEVNHLVDLGYSSDSYLEPRFGFAYAPNWNQGIIGKAYWRKPSDPFCAAVSACSHRPCVPIDLLTSQPGSPFQSAKRRVSDARRSRHVRRKSVRRLSFHARSSGGTIHPCRRRPQSAHAVHRTVEPDLRALTAVP